VTPRTSSSVTPSTSSSVTHPATSAPPSTAKSEYWNNTIFCLPMLLLVHKARRKSYSSIKAWLKQICIVVGF
jgi:hypothetical protein